jgi:hypothetical protein
MVVVNPGTGSASLTLGRSSLVNASGQSVTRATIAPHSGAIFTN